MERCDVCVHAFDSGMWDLGPEIWEAGSGCKSEIVPVVWVWSGEMWRCVKQPMDCGADISHHCCVPK